MRSSEERPSLTSRQRELLDFIQGCVGQDNRMPSYREMAKAMKVSAVGTIQDMVSVLVKRGYLERVTLAPKEKNGKPRHALKLGGPRSAPVVNVPIVGEVAAGQLQDAFEVALGSVPVSVHLLGARGKPGDHFALRVVGESMIDAGILPGDIAIIDRRANVQSGDTAVVELHGEATLKEIQFPKRGDKFIRLIPHNSSMKPILIDKNDELKIVGKIVALQRFF